MKKGLGEYLYDEQRKTELLVEMPTLNKKGNTANSIPRQQSDYDLINSYMKAETEKFNLETSDIIKCNKQRNFYLISNSMHTECFVINKELYLKYMLNFACNDRNKINKYLDSLVFN